MLTVPVDDARWNLHAYARVADRLFLMDYDQHFIGDQPGPIAAQEMALIDAAAIRNPPHIIPGPSWPFRT